MRSSRPSSPEVVARAWLAATVFLLVAACSAAPGPTAAAPVVSGAWVRPPAGPDRPAAAYMTIRNPGERPEALLGATSTAATTVELHRTTMDSGMAGMHPVSSLHIPAGGTVSLAPGGFHLMLIGPRPMAVGDTVDLVLQFEGAGKLSVKAEVKNG